MEVVEHEVVRCRAVTKAGTPCRVPALKGGTTCLVHSDATRELRKAASQKGGYNRSDAIRVLKRMPAGITDRQLCTLLSNLFKDTVAGKVEPRTATAAAAVGRVLLEAQRVSNQPSVEQLQQAVIELRNQ